MSTRTGIGYDAHRLQADLTLWLGGVKIEFEKGLDGHSDGDVLIHAIVDAMLGAAALGDIGLYFPSSDPQYKGISSRVFLTTISKKLSETGWRVVNLDATIIAEKPRLAEFIPMICDRVSQDINVDKHQVNVKSTTNDGMGFIGRNEGIAAYAVVTIEETNDSIRHA